MICDHVMLPRAPSGTSLCLGSLLSQRWVPVLFHVRTDCSGLGDVAQMPTSHSAALCSDTAQAGQDALPVPHQDTTSRAGDMKPGWLFGQIQAAGTCFVWLENPQQPFGGNDAAHALGRCYQAASCPVGIRRVKRGWRDST